MIAAAPKAELRAMETIRRRLGAHEAERARTPLSPRRTELDGLVTADIESLCLAFKKLERAVDDRADVPER
jgi:hypothetical protein